MTPEFLAQIQNARQVAGLTVRLADGGILCFADKARKADYIARHAAAVKSGRYDAIGGVSSIIEA